MEEQGDGHLSSQLCLHRTVIGLNYGLVSSLAWSQVGLSHDAQILHIQQCLWEDCDSISKSERVSVT